MGDFRGRNRKNQERGHLREAKKRKSRRIGCQEEQRKQFGYTKHVARVKTQPNTQPFPIVQNEHKRPLIPIKAQTMKRELEGDKERQVCDQM